jgi:hypothetical protein
MYYFIHFLANFQLSTIHNTSLHLILRTMRNRLPAPPVCVLQSILNFYTCRWSGWKCIVQSIFSKTNSKLQWCGTNRNTFDYQVGYHDLYIFIYLLYSTICGNWCWEHIFPWHFQKVRREQDMNFPKATCWWSFKQCYRSTFKDDNGTQRNPGIAWASSAKHHI